MKMPRWQFSLRALLVVMTIAAALVAVIANYPMVSLLIAGVASSLAFLIIAAICAVFAFLGFRRVWRSFEAENVGKDAPPTDKQ